MAYTKKPLSEELLAECQAANALYLSKKNALKLNQRKIAEAAGITPVSVNQYLRGINPLNAKFAAVLARAIQEPIESFSPRLAAEIAELSNTGPMIQPKRQAKEYPLVSWVNAGEGVESSGCYPAGISDEWLSSTENAGPKGYWLRVKGISMTADTQPSFPEGTPILIQPEGFDLISGKYYIAENMLTGDKTFKKYELDAGVGYLVPLNADFQAIKMDEHWVITGRAIDAKITGM